MRLFVRRCSCDKAINFTKKKRGKASSSENKTEKYDLDGTGRRSYICVNGSINRFMWKPQGIVLYERHRGLHQ